MPLPYAVLKGRPVGNRLATSRNKHYQELISADGEQHHMPLSGVIEMGLTKLVPIVQPVALSNNGGITTLLDGRGIKGHGVSHIQEQAEQPGRTIPCQS